jgi:hypothetical protein
VKLVRTAPGEGYCYFGGTKDTGTRNGADLPDLPGHMRWHVYDMNAGEMTGDALSDKRDVNVRVIVVTHGLVFKGRNEKWNDAEAFIASSLEQFLIFAAAAVVGFDIDPKYPLGRGVHRSLRNSSDLSFNRYVCHRTCACTNLCLHHVQVPVLKQVPGLPGTSLWTTLRCARTRRCCSAWVSSSRSM